MMIRKLLSILLLLLVAGFPLAHVQEAKAGDESAPAVKIVNSSLTFDKVMDGTKVTRNFVIKNTGNATLDIIKVRPG